MKARFHFFYSFCFCKRPIKGFDTNVPTRDILNTHRTGNKTEPYFEKWIENWCDCRQHAIAAAVKEADVMSPKEHYLILTTRHSITKERLAVGYLKFDQKRHHSLGKLRRFYNCAFYPGSLTDSRVCSFSGAFRFGRNYQFTPGARYGVQKASDSLAARIIGHLRRKKNRIREFRKNVALLEKHLKQSDSTAFKSYMERIHLRNTNCYK